MIIRRHTRERKLASRTGEKVRLGREREANHSVRRAGKQDQNPRMHGAILRQNKNLAQGRGFVPSGRESQASATSLHQRKAIEQAAQLERDSVHAAGWANNEAPRVPPDGEARCGQRLARVPQASRIGQDIIVGAKWHATLCVAKYLILLALPTGFEPVLQP